ncbi:MAG: IS66 family insertion sequence element accessory protein TnpA [Methylobacter sp.]
MASSTDWINHIKMWQRSGLKQAAYCRQQNLKYPTFSARLSD